MILQALNEYYDRMAATSLAETRDGKLPPEGYAYQKIYHALVIDTEGNLVAIRSSVPTGRGESHSSPCSGLQTL